MSVFNQGENNRDYVYVKDVISALIKIKEKGVFQIGNCKEYNTLDLVKLSGVKWAYGVYNDNEMATIKLDNTKIKKLGWNSTLKVTEFIQKMKECKKRREVMENNTNNMQPNDKLVFVSFYTRNTGYEKEITNLIESYEKFKLPYIIEAVDNKYHWQKNVKIKAEIIKKRLIENPDKAVVYLDADSVIRQYPSLFFEIKEDIGVNYRDWSSSHQLNGAVLFFNNTPKTMEIVDEWIKRNNADIERYDQDILKEVLKERKDVSVYCLPLEYCKIFDLDAKRVNNPVIEQYQASRKFKTKVATPQENLESEAVLLLEKKEKEKYQQGWSRGVETSSQTGKFIAKYFVGRINKKWNILEIGCGAGNATRDLRGLGYKVTGVDITLEAVKEKEGFLKHHYGDFHLKIMNLIFHIQRMF